MRIRGDLPIPRDKIQKILDSPVPYESESEDETAIKSILNQLTPEQIEIAAQTSYAYWLATMSDKPPTEEERQKMAFREIRRTCFKPSLVKALSFAQETAQLRVNRRMDIIRSCFMENAEYDCPEDMKLANELRGIIEDDMAKQIAVVRGVDKEGILILTVFPRTEKCTSDESFLYLILYAMEKATAVVEYLSLGAQEKIMVVLDFHHFDSSVAPSWHAAKAVAVTMQHNYPQRLKRLVWLDPPFWIRTVYAMVSPFLDPLTKKKFVLCAGEAQKQAVMELVVEAGQAMTVMRPDGLLSSKIDTHHYLHRVPFHLPYDDPHHEGNGKS